MYNLIMQGKMERSNLSGAETWVLLLATCNHFRIGLDGWSEFVKLKNEATRRVI